MAPNDCFHTIHQELTTGIQLTNGAKRRRGSKVHMAVDTLGHLLAVRVTTGRCSWCSWRIPRGQDADFNRRR